MATSSPVTQEAFQFVEKTYESGAISVRYPQISNLSDPTLQDRLNKIIEDSALRDLPFTENIPERYTITDTVALNRPDVISIYFDGYVYMKDAAHPNQFFYSVTIDVNQLQTLTLPQLVSVSPDFVNLLNNGDFRSAGFDMTEDIALEVQDFIGSMGTDFWTGKLRNADAWDSDTSSYLTEDALGISIFAPHVLGDHIEIMIKFNDLHGYQTDNPIWKVIEAP